MSEDTSLNQIYDSLNFRNKLVLDKGYHVNSHVEDNNDYNNVVLPSTMKRGASGIFSINPLSSIQEAASIDEISHFSRLVRFKSRQMHLQPPRIVR